MRSGLEVALVIDLPTRRSPRGAVGMHDQRHFEPCLIIDLDAYRTARHDPPPSADPGQGMAA